MLTIRVAFDAGHICDTEILMELDEVDELKSAESYVLKFVEWRDDSKAAAGVDDHPTLCGFCWAEFILSRHQSISAL